MGPRTFLISLRLEYGDDDADAAQEEIKNGGIEEPAEIFFQMGSDKPKQVVQVACYGNKKQ